MSEKNQLNFVEALKDCRNADPYQLVEKLNQLFLTIRRMNANELLAAKQTIDLLVELHEFDGEPRKMLDHIIASLTERAWQVRENAYSGGTEEKLLTGRYFPQEAIEKRAEERQRARLSLVGFIRSLRPCSR